MSVDPKFLEAMREGACYAPIPVLDIPDWYDAIRQHLNEQGYTGQALTNTMRSNLRGICPDCYTWLDSTALFGPSMIRGLGQGKSTLFGGGSTSRMLDGLCPNADCSSRQIVLIWRGPPGIMSLVEETADWAAGLRQDGPVNRFLRKDTLNYAADAIWLQRIKASPYHLYTGHRSREGDLCTWVSVMNGFPDEKEARQRFFPDGYMLFLDTLLADSHYDSGDVALMHWIYGFEQGRRVLYFTFVDNQSNREREGHLILPLDILDGMERDTLKL